jgi:hypothetical protein
MMDAEMIKILRHLNLRRNYRSLKSWKVEFKIVMIMLRIDDCKKNIENGWDWLS